MLTTTLLPWHKKCIFLRSRTELFFFFVVVVLHLAQNKKLAELSQSKEYSEY